MVLEGNCYLNIKVKITFDQTDSLRYIPQKLGKDEEIESTASNNNALTRLNHSIPDTFTAKFKL